MWSRFNELTKGYRDRHELFCYTANKSALHCGSDYSKLMVLFSWRVENSNDVVESRLNEIGAILASLSCCEIGH